MEGWKKGRVLGGALLRLSWDVSHSELGMSPIKREIEKSPNQNMLRFWTSAHNQNMLRFWASIQPLILHTCIVVLMNIGVGASSLICMQVCKAWNKQRQKPQEDVVDDRQMYEPLEGKAETRCCKMLSIPPDQWISRHLGVVNVKVWISWWMTA